MEHCGCLGGGTFRQFQKNLAQPTGSAYLNSGMSASNRRFPRFKCQVLAGSCYRVQGFDPTTSAHSDQFGTAVWPKPV